MILQPCCWVPYSAFVLPCSSWTCEVNPLCSPTSCSTASVRRCGLVLDCGSMIVRRWSWNLRGFGASLPVAWSQPTFVTYKASYPLFVACYPCSFDLLLWRSGHPRADSYWYLSTGIKAFIITVGLTIIHISSFSLSIICYFVHHL